MCWMHKSQNKIYTLNFLSTTLKVCLDGGMSYCKRIQILWGELYYLDNNSKNFQNDIKFLSILFKSNLENLKWQLKDKKFKILHCYKFSNFHFSPQNFQFDPKKLWIGPSNFSKIIIWPLKFLKFTNWPLISILKFGPKK